MVKMVESVIGSCWMVVDLALLRADRYLKPRATCVTSGAGVRRPFNPGHPSPRAGNAVPRLKGKTWFSHPSSLAVQIVGMFNGNMLGIQTIPLVGESDNVLQRTTTYLTSTQ